VVSPPTPSRPAPSGHVALHNPAIRGFIGATFTFGDGDSLNMHAGSADMLSRPTVR